ncbi:MAG: hypothetical protein ACKO2G_03740, partial [Verrucomicrobiales bacterium]
QGSRHLPHPGETIDRATHTPARRSLISISSGIAGIDGIAGLADSLPAVASSEGWVTVGFRFAGIADDPVGFRYS